jgi:hypothetical protein
MTRDYEGFSGTDPLSSKAYFDSGIFNQSFHSFLGSKPRLLSDVVTSDPLWQHSNYSTAWSIQDIMDAIEKSYDDNGCGQRWCYHMFPSYTVYLDEEYNRTGRIIDDFYKRTKNSTRVWKKSIIQTRYAMMGGFHLSGSCHYPDDPEFYSFAAEPECLPQIWDSGEAGSVHHFVSLVGYREDPYFESDVIEDEYLVLYGKTVSMQLDRGRQYVSGLLKVPSRSNI